MITARISPPIMEHVQIIRPASRAESTSPTSAAQTKALRTPEILEMILLHVDLQSLLVSAQRVCRDWLDLTSSSPALQRAMFFQPEPATTSTAKARRRKNPLLERLFPTFFSPMPHVQVPTIESMFAHIPGSSHNTSDSFEYSASTTHRDALTRRGASWRRMLIAQPALNPKIGFVFAFDFDSSYWFGTTWETAQLNLPDSESERGGLMTMGVLWDVVYENAIARKSNHEVGMRVWWKEEEEEEEEEGGGWDIFAEGEGHRQMGYSRPEKMAKCLATFDSDVEIVVRIANTCDGKPLPGYLHLGRRAQWLKGLRCEEYQQRLWPPGCEKSGEGLGEMREVYTLCDK
ncbi:hypothetical protein B0H63DRAFT_559838 [Podospora didyma]|uniref:F-box domain-containing protein n=1 Tax=Podospora didyma TaxID=330526 RepID=A0AAE0TZD6_9PEZI|nr:hypothetical protein B0H63DRAFT_559838 [Podospora didyma]